MTVISVADLVIELRNKYKYTKDFCSGYESDLEPTFSVEATEEQICAEAAVSEEGLSNGYLESVVLYRNIAERLPEFSATVFHGAVIALGGVAYLVTAKSGVGKTTHLGLWLSEFGSDVHILNGDKPILRVIDGVVYACGTPWRGKEFYGVNEMLPLGGIAFLSRAPENSAVRVTPSEVLNEFITQSYVPKNPIGARLGLITLNKILTSTPLHRLYVNMDPEAAHVARRAFTENN
jgi:hypothetical protein